ncbi:FAD-dependent oxidoreductase [Nonomuraea soli]|uniref:Kynurenine 3-monooxygenase n=1 Tax=Nonomuraea soli TaxID=1032476 RepID=A0A7W0CG61_9ACTN|nr:NAD(P)/FAD-dependent oxidoreductase [Nonomuraea soli]MBA2890565.1 kynurenine 3-monooxygenase [Nonomuraea soli]
MKALIVGGGLSGPLLSIFLSARGHEVELVERRPDPRTSPPAGGRSINLGVSARGIRALRAAGLWAEVRKLAVPMRGRMVHLPGRAPAFHPYGRSRDQILHSVRRDGLASLLVERAEKQSGVRLTFDTPCLAVDPDTATLTLPGRQVTGDFVVGADGASSVVRTALHRRLAGNFRRDHLEWGYLELTIPASAGLPIEALHLWPGSGGLAVAHPNLDGSLTCTLFLPRQGSDPAALIAGQLPGLTALIPDLPDQLAAAEMSTLTTVRTSPWQHDGRVVLVGDACHAVYPFYGQGMNSSFEDCVVLDRCLGEHPPAEAFAAYERARRPHTDVLAELSERNFFDLRDGVRSPLAVARKRLDLELHRLFPHAWVPLYTLVSHTTVPYGDALRRARTQERIAAAAAGLTGAALVAATGIAARRFRRERTST